MDALSLDKYVLAHTVLIKNMVEPLLGGGGSRGRTRSCSTCTPRTWRPQWVSRWRTRSPIDQYAKAHTVMIANMLKPLLGSDLSSC